MSKEDFYSLTPDLVLKAAEDAGFVPTGRLQQLNSYENRVFELFLEKDTYPQSFDRIIAKFYRPGRWDQATIAEEHEFLSDLHHEGLPVVAAIKTKHGTIGKHKGMFCAFFPKAPARMLDEIPRDQFKILGALLAQLHNVGAQKKAHHRPTLAPTPYGEDDLVILQDVIFPDLYDRYMDATLRLFDWFDDNNGGVSMFRIHGDCHRGNILRAALPDDLSPFYFVDFDDFVTGPAVHDFWMLLSGDPGVDETAKDELTDLIEGYSRFRSFNQDEVKLIPALRALRIVHYSAWISQRWEDPSFPLIFPQFKDFNYWAREVEALEKAVSICRQLPG
jgi:Ser/Thr protein kinase RdoA (MazF antagonist)